MKIAVSNIPEDGMSIRFSKDENWIRSYLPEAADGHYRLQAVDVSCSLKRVRETVYLEGQLNTTVFLECSRCLDETALTVNGRFNYVFSPTADVHDEEQELSADEMDFVYYEDESIDLDPVIYEQIVMHIPIKVLCSESCRGLCPHCGINLNRESCQCQDQHVDERFAILKKLKV